MGYVDKEGKFIINPQFDDAYVFFDDFAVIKSSDKYGLIDKKGKIVVNPQFEQIKTIFNDNSLVSTDYVDITSIIEVINLNNPEGLNFTTSFFEIANKYSKKASDFSSYDSAPILVNKKQVNSFADYNFQVLGNFVSFNYENYENVFNNDSPYGFVYSIIKNTFSTQKKSSPSYRGVAQLVARLLWECRGGIRDRMRRNAVKPCDACVCGTFPGC